jgi:predicted lipoprotein with Yx(FWY)xxD motif
VTRTYILLAAVLTGVVSTSALTSAQADSPIARSGKAATVQLRNTRLGKILVDASGFTLYEFSRDSRNSDTCVRISGCSKVWPALISAKPTAGPGVKGSLLSTITLPGGTKQVTYAGHALYHYNEATERAETSYVGVSHFGGRWYGVNAAGGTVR